MIKKYIFQILQESDKTKIKYKVKKMSYLCK